MLSFLVTRVSLGPAREILPIDTSRRKMFKIAPTILTASLAEGGGGWGGRQQRRSVRDSKDSRTCMQSLFTNKVKFGPGGRVEKEMLDYSLFAVSIADRRESPCVIWL